MSSLVDEFFDYGTFTDDYFKNVIEPYKQGLRPRPSFSEAIRYARPLKAFMPQALGGTFYTKPTPMVMNFLKGLGQGALRGAGIFSLFAPSRELGSGEITPEFIQEQQDLGQLPIQQAIAQQQAETQQKIIDEVKQSGGGGGPAGMVGTPTGPGQTGGPAGMGFAPSDNPTGFGSNIRIGKANGGIVSLFGRF